LIILSFKVSLNVKDTEKKKHENIIKTFNMSKSITPIIIKVNIIINNNK